MYKPVWPCENSGQSVTIPNKTLTLSVGFFGFGVIAEMTFNLCRVLMSHRHPSRW